MSAIDLKEIGKRICERRRHLNLTQEIVAEKMNVSVQMISNLERGNKAIKIDNLVKLSKILSVSTDYILTGKTFTERNPDLISENISKLSDKEYKMIEMIIKYCGEN